MVFSRTAPTRLTTWDLAKFPPPEVISQRFPGEGMQVYRQPVDIAPSAVEVLDGMSILNNPVRRMFEWVERGAAFARSLPVK